jgi:aminoglycoside phosphotransferase (APT) family kinase protein
VCYEYFITLKILSFCMCPDRDVIAVRADEQFDHQAMQSYLHRQVPHAEGALEVRQFGGGHANLTYLLRMGEQEWVMRRPPLGPTLPTAHDMRREFRVLSALATTDVPVPRPVVLCDDLSVIGVPFYLMERRRGVVMRDTLPPEIGDDRATRQQVSAAVVDALAALHAVDWQALGLEDFGRPTGYLVRQLRRWAEQWERARTRPVPALERVLEWLQQHLPGSSRSSIVHGDYKLDNLMLNIQAPVQVVAILDWEMSTLGDPLADLGWLLSQWPQPGDSATRIGVWWALTVEPGFLRRHELVARYEERTGQRATAIDFYEILGLYKNAVIIEGIYARFVAGQTHDTRFAEFGTKVEIYADIALALTQRARL